MSSEISIIPNLKEKSVFKHPIWEPTFHQSSNQPNRIYCDDEPQKKLYKQTKNRDKENQQ